MAMTAPIRLVHLYPAEMNIYGDMGNVLTLVKRLEWRGYETDVVRVGLGDAFDMTTADIVFGGGGQDSGQSWVAADLSARAENLRAAADAGVVMLVVCGTYQLFGRSFEVSRDLTLPGIGIFDADTTAGATRLIGNIVVDTPWGALVGFENHSGRTILDPGATALGQVVKGYGNSGRKEDEGAVAHNVFGTYLHGPVLPKNPAFADHLIRTALERRGIAGALPPLDDELEHRAAEVATQRPQ
jgi:CobQ-like glutamine amidotransferase family enzyme